MNLWPFARQSKSASSGATTYSSATLSQLLAAAFGGGPTRSGASVTTDSALQVSVVLACVRVLAEGVAQVPWRLVQRSGRVTNDLRTHPLWRLLHRKPNRWQTSFAFRETMMLHALIGPLGAAVAFKSRVGAAQRVAELILLDPKRIKIDVADDGTRLFQVRAKSGGQVRTLTDDDVWYFPGPSWDGTTAMPLIHLAREAIGLTMSTEDSQSALHHKGLKPSGIYSVEGSLSPKQYDDLKAWIEREFGGAANAGKPMILDRNAKFVPTALTGVDAQHLETRKHQVEEVCRMFRVLPIMVGQADKAATYASAEQMFLAHLVHSLMPWYERLEQSADCTLLTDAELDAGCMTLLDHSQMLRGALKDTAEYLAKLVQLGVLTRNEAREFVDRNPLDGLDEPLTPINLAGAQPADPQGATP